MKSYTQFIKEVNTSVYGEVKVGSKSPTVTKKSISSGVDSAIKNLGTGKSGGSTVAKKGGYGLSGGVNVSMSGGSSGSPTTTKTPTKVKPLKTVDPAKDPIKPTPPRGSKPILSPLAQRVSDIRMGRM